LESPRTPELQLVIQNLPAGFDDLREEARAVIRTTMLWHRRFDDQPAHLWLRKLVQQTAECQ
jgi:hypothetical protein